nr:MAG TPA: hypothetical protein [Caudoviricetes sp.]
MFMQNQAYKLSSTTATRVNTCENNISALQTGKADASTVTELQTTVEGKADDSSLIPKTNGISGQVWTSKGDGNGEWQAPASSSTEWVVYKGKISDLIKKQMFIIEYHVYINYRQYSVCAVVPKWATAEIGYGIASIANSHTSGQFCYIQGSKVYDVNGEEITTQDTSENEISGSYMKYRLWVKG